MRPEWPQRVRMAMRRVGLSRGDRPLRIHGRPSEQPMVFVTNVVRSGSTLTQVVLSGHPKVCICPEAAWLDRFLDRQPRSSRLTGRALQRFAADAADDAKLSGWKIDMSSELAGLHRHRAVDIRDFTRRVFERYAQNAHPGATHLGIKKGSLLPWWRELLRLWPESRFIFTVRDARDSVASAVAKLRNADVPQQCHHWNQRVAIALAAASEQPERMRIVRYEDLALFPESTARGMCEFLNIAYASQMIETAAGNRAYEQISNGYEQLHHRTNQPIDATRVYAWTRGGDPSETTKIEALTASHLDALGYERRTQRQAA